MAQPTEWVRMPALPKATRHSGSVTWPRTPGGFWATSARPPTRNRDLIPTLTTAVGLRFMARLLRKECGQEGAECTASSTVGTGCCLDGESRIWRPSGLAACWPLDGLSGKAEGGGGRAALERVVVPAGAILAFPLSSESAFRGPQWAELPAAEVHSKRSSRRRRRGGGACSCGSQVRTGAGPCSLCRRQADS